MPFRFFKLDKTHWTTNIVAAAKFGFSCGLAYATVPYVLLIMVKGIPSVSFVVMRISEGLMDGIFLGLLYYALLVLLDLHHDPNSDEKPSEN